MKIPTLLLLHPFVVIFVFFLLLVGVYILFRPMLSRSADSAGQGKHPLRMVVIFAYLLAA